MQDRALLMRGELRNDTRSNTTKPQSFHKNDDGHDNVSDSDTDSGGDDDDMSATCKGHEGTTSKILKTVYLLNF